MLILGILGFGMLVGALAQLVLGRDGRGFDWGMAIVAGLAGSFVGGLLFSLIAGDGLRFRPSGLIGSFVGAVVITAVWRAIVARRKHAGAAEAHADRRSGNPARSKR